jgi:lipoate---protein ligase
MNLLDLTLPSPAENLALDEALLDAAESGGGGEVLRLWESPAHFVVLGAGCRAAEDVDLERCAAEGVPVLRRCSGGGTVLQGPGCLSYALVLEKARRPGVDTIAGTNRLVLGTIARALNGIAGAVSGVQQAPGGAAHAVAGVPQAPGNPAGAIQPAGISDLAADGRKFSGNAQRRRKHCILFHGTLLYRMDLRLMARYLREPAKQPDYRTRRPHCQFVDNLPASTDDLRRALADTFQASRQGQAWPTEAVQLLVETKYSQDAWNLQF